MKYIILVLFLSSCSMQLPNGNYIKQNKKTFSINWSEVEKNNQSLEGVGLIKELLPVILKTKQHYGLSRNIPNSVFLAMALYETQDGVFYFNGTNNPFNIECYEKHKDGNHCVERDGRRIRVFKDMEFAVQHQANIIASQYNKNTNYKKFIEGLLNSKIFISELNYNYSILCIYIKTYDLQKYDTLKKAK